MSMRISWYHFAFGVWMAFIPCRRALAQSSSPVKESTPIEPIAAILDAFHTHRLVALGADHKVLQVYAFQMALIHHPEFAGLVNDIVVEAGNSLYQDVMDKFLAGEDVPYDALRRVWQDTTQPLSNWDTPIYEELYRAVRALNSGLPEERRLRVLLGDPPVDWAAVHTASDLRSQMGPVDSRDTYPTELIRREVLAKGRRALIVYGGLHLQRHDYLRNYEPSQRILEMLERDAPGSVFSIWGNTASDLQAAQPSVSSWPKPSLTILRDTLLGAQDFAFYYPFKVTFMDKDDNPVVPQPPRRSLRMEQQFDAVLYLGPKSSMTYSSLPAALCRDQAYVKMRLARLELSFPGPLPPGFPPPEVDVKKQCEAALANGWSPITAPK